MLSSMPVILELSKPFTTLQVPEILFKSVYARQCARIVAHFFIRNKGRCSVLMLWDAVTCGKSILTLVS